MMINNKIPKPYDVWLNWVVTEKCNIQCEYCCICDEIKNRSVINAINIDAVLDNLNNSGNTFKVEFTGGEPFLIPNIVEAMKAIASHHFIAFNSNLLSKKVPLILDSVHPDKVDFINASFHIGELERKNLVDKFMSHYYLLKSANFPICIVMVGYPKLKERILFYMEEFEKSGIDFLVLPFYGTCNDKSYPESYTSDELSIFKIEQNLFEGEKRHYRRNKFCNAGYNAITADYKGDVRSCHLLRKVLGNLYSGFELKESLALCPSDFCSCPVSVFDSFLFEKAKSECNKVRLSFNCENGAYFEKKHILLDAENTNATHASNMHL